MKVYNRAMKTHMDLREVYYQGKQRRGIYADMLEKLAALIRRRANNQKQTVVVISGRPGSAKSTKAITLARLIDPEWELEEGYIYSADDLRELLLRGHGRRSINLFDEGSITFNSLNSNARDDKGMVGLLDTLRSWEMTSIIAIPGFHDLNRRIREHLVDFWIQCPEEPLGKKEDPRAYFEIYVPTTNEWTGKTYWHYLGAGTCGKLPRDINEVYQQIKYDHQMKLVRAFIEGQTKKTRKKKEEGEDE